MAVDMVNETGEARGQYENLQRTINQNMQRAKTESSDWRVGARECYDFSAGRQWSDEDRAILEEQRRPPVTFNRISRTLNAVIGLEVSNRQEARFIPRGNEDTGFNTMLTDAARWTRDLCDAEDEETEAFGDLNTCGMGWTETMMDYEEDPDGMLQIDRADPLTMYWDSNSTKKNLADARWMARVGLMSLDQVLENWEHYDGGGSSEEYLENESEPHDSSPPWYDNSDASKRGHINNIEVVHYQWYEKQEFVRVKSGDRMIEFTPTKFSRIKERIEEMGLKYVKQKRRVYYKAISIGGKVYEKEECAVQEGGFTFKCMTGMRDRNKKMWFGLVAIMIDPQRWANKWLAQTMHIMNTNAKGGVMAEIGAFANPSAAERDWAKSDAFIEMEAGGLDKIREREMGKFPQGVHELMKYAVESISDTPGINQELMGLVGKEQPGVLESMRKQAGVTMLSVMFDALRLYRKRQARTLAAFIREYMSDGRLIRVVGPEGAKYVPLLRDQVSMKYDTIIDEAPTSHNQKEKVMQILLTLVPQMMEAGMPPPPPDVLEYLPVPESLIEKWLAKTKPNPEKEKKQQQEAEEERQVLLAERKSKADMQSANAKKAAADAQKTMSELEQGIQNEDPRMKLAAEQQKAQIKAQADTDIAMMKAQVAAETERQVAAMKARIEAETDLQIARMRAVTEQQIARETAPA